MARSLTMRLKSRNNLQINIGTGDHRMVQHYYHLHDEEAHRQMGSLRLFDDLSDDGAAEA